MIDKNAFSVKHGVRCVMFLLYLYRIKSGRAEGMNLSGLWTNMKTSTFVKRLWWIAALTY